MKKILMLVACSAFSFGAFAKGGSHAVSGHVTKNGTYVAPTRATNPDSTKENNYSHKGNVNPYNGKPGAKN